MNEQKFIKLIRTGNFFEAIKFLNCITSDQLYTILMDLSFEKNEDLSPYFFILELIFDKESAEYHSIASTLLAMPFCWMPGAYNIGFRHAQRAIALDPKTISYRKGLFLFVDFTDLISLEEAGEQAKYILKVFPEDTQALDIIKRLEKRRRNE